MKILHELDLGELKQIRKHQQDAIALHIPVAPITFLNLDVFSKVGEHISQYNDRSRSWVRNAYNVLITQFCMIVSIYGGTYGPGGMYNKDTSGVNQSYSIKTQAHSSCTSTTRAGAGDTTYGIMIGTGATAENFEDYKLNTPILHGTTAGKMQYGSMPTEVISYNAGTKTISTLIERQFTNISGGTITVAETGIYAVLFHNASYPGMVLRDLLVSAVEVPNDTILRVRYTIEGVYPA